MESLKVEPMFDPPDTEPAVRMELPDNPAITLNRLLTDIAIKDGDVNKACSLAIRQIELVKQAATRRHQEMEEIKRRNDAVNTSASIIVDMNMPLGAQP